MAVEKLAAGSLGASTASKCFAPRAFLPILVAATFLTIVVVMIRMETIQVRHVRHKNPSPNQRKLRTFDKKSPANTTTCKCQDAYLRSRITEYQRLLKQVVEEHRLLQSKFNDTLLFLGRCLKRHKCPTPAQQSPVEILQDESPTMIAPAPAKDPDTTEVSAPQSDQQKKAAAAVSAKKISVDIPGGPNARKSDTPSKEGDEKPESQATPLNTAKTPGKPNQSRKNASLAESVDEEGLDNASLTRGGDSFSNVTKLYTDAKNSSENGSLHLKKVVGHTNNTGTATGSDNAHIPETSRQQAKNESKTNAAVESNPDVLEGTGKVRSKPEGASVETQTGSDKVVTHKPDKEALLAEPKSRVFADVKVNFDAFGKLKKPKKPASAPKANSENAVAQNKIPDLNSKLKDSKVER